MVNLVEQLDQSFMNLKDASSPLHTMDLSKYPMGTYIEDSEYEDYFVAYEVSQYAIIAYYPLTGKVGLWGVNHLFPTPGFSLFNKNQDADGTPTNNPEKSFHAALDYLKSPKGLFTLIMCAGGEIHKKYGVDVGYITDEMGAILNRRGNVIASLKWNRNGIVMNTSQYSTFPDAMNFIKQIAGN